MTWQKFVPQATKDGSYTFFSDDFQEAFHSFHGAKQEAEIKFVQPTLITNIAQHHNSIRLLDICYGLGYNSAAAMEAIWQINPQCHIELIALEISAAVPQQAIANNLLNQWRSPIPQLLAELAQTYAVSKDLFQGKLLLGDARQTIQQVGNWQADAVFLDPFSPPKCPQLWTVEFIAKVAQCLAPQGRLATYSCAAAVRSALILAGLKIGSTAGVGRKSPGTVAAYVDQYLTPLSLQEQEHLQSRAAIPYRDSSLSSSPNSIHELRAQEQQKSILESTSKWKKRWLSLNT
ncbi:MAG: MnmC family methyltransferase [Xenococcus sp. MO_188.B8]|nr:MnmC family methyltransferase [Xenococcus sp. MO_188.B8]